MRALAAAALALVPALAPGPATAQGSVWVHAAVETRSAPGEQVTTFRAFAASDQAGTQRVVVARLCVRGIAHQVQERCAENVDAVEVTERTIGLPGVGSLCVEAVATATAAPGGVPLTATARACP